MNKLILHKQQKNEKQFWPKVGNLPKVPKAFKHSFSHAVIHSFMHAFFQSPQSRILLRSTCNHTSIQPFNHTSILSKILSTLFRIISIILFLFAVPNTTFAQEEVDEGMLEKLRKMSLEEILDIKISITSQIPISMREAPGIVTLITRDDILNSGAKDLLDVFNLLVPGFHFMQSEFGPIGIGVRGLWAYEGKVLFLIDGVECNEEGFSSVIFGNHYLTENIERIEVIRGPGTVVYGGSAGLGVINIVTKNYNQLDGGYAGVSYSQMYSTFSNRNISFGIGKEINQLGISLTGYAGESRLSDRKYVPYFPDYYTLETHKIKSDPIHLNFNLTYKDFDFRSIFERHYLHYGIPINFNSFNFLLKHKLKLEEKFILTSKIEGKYQQPWEFNSSGLIPINGNLTDTVFGNNKNLHKTTGSLSFQWEFLPKFHLLTGLEAYWSEINSNPKPGIYEYPLNNNKLEAELNNYVAYSQLMYTPRLINLIVGARLEHSNIWGTYFVPRIALTRIFGKFHMKAMVSQSYRNPSGRYLDKNIKPEKGMNYEIETGYQISNSHFLVMNFYDIMYSDIISLVPDSLLYSFHYDNLDKIGSRGFELEYKLIKTKFSLGFNLSYFSITKNTLELFKAYPDKNDVLGFPSVKINAFAGFKVSNNISINPSISFFSERYGFIKGNYFVESDGKTQVENVLKEFEPTFIVNLNFRTKDLVMKGLQADLGVHNIFNSNYEYIQAFRGYYAPLPAASSSINLRLLYEFSF